MQRVRTGVRTGVWAGPWQEAEPRRGPRLKPGSRAAAALVAACGVVACGLGLAGCRGPLDGDFDARVGPRTRSINHLRLEDAAGATPVTVEEALKALKENPPLREAVPAGESVALTIDALRADALRHNLDLEVVRVDPRIAAERVSEEEAKFDAIIGAGVSYERIDQPRLDSDLVEFTAADPDLNKQVVKLTEVEQEKEKLKFDPGLRVPLPTGGTVGVRNIFEESNKTSPQRFEQYTNALSFSVSQPLLRNAGVDVNTASIRIARLEAGAISARTKLAAIRVLASTEKAYWRVDAARRALDVRRQQYRLASENLDFIRRRIAAGLTPAIQEFTAEVAVAQRLESLITAETALRLQERELKRLLNRPDLPIESATRVEPASEPRLVRYALNREELASRALAERMELLELELQIAADGTRVDFARNQVLPSFVLDFEYGVLDRDAQFSTTFNGMFDFDNTTYRVGARAEIPVTNDAAEARLRRALLTRVQRLATRAQRELAVRQEVYDALDVLEQDWQRILAARQNVAVSAVNYEAEVRQLEAGTGTALNVLLALNQLGEAQIREVQAIVSYQVSQIDLAFATGTLLGYARTDAAAEPGAMLQDATPGDTTPVDVAPGDLAANAANAADAAGAANAAEAGGGAGATGAAEPVGPVGGVAGPGAGAVPDGSNAAPEPSGPNMPPETPGR